MNKIQMIAILELSIFYIAYVMKMMLQRKKGIQTNQLGKGVKEKRTLLVEKILACASFLIIPADLISIFLDANLYSNEGVRYFGLALIFAGNIFFIVAMWTMRDSWRAGIPKTDKTEIVTGGIYKISRNPAFLGFDLTYIGFFLAFDNVILLLASIFAIGAMHMQILEEEKFMEMTFKGTYIEYKKKVGRYLFLI